MRFLRTAALTGLAAALLAAALPSSLSEPPEEAPDDREGPQQGEKVVRGRVLLPTVATTRPFFPLSTNGLTHFWLPEVTPGASFTLRSDSRALVGLPCSALGCLPDFDVVFYGATARDGFEHSEGRFNKLGDESGHVPRGAEFAFVFLRLGPNLALDLGGTPFTYAES